MDGGCYTSLNAHLSEFKTIRSLRGSRLVQGVDVEINGIGTVEVAVPLTTGGCVLLEITALYTPNLLQ